MTPNFSIKSLLRVLFPWRNVYLVEQIAGEVARACRAGLWQQVCRRTSNLSIAEIRGYVRAQAAGYVDSEVEQVICRRHLKPALRDRLVAAAVDQLVNLVAHDVFCGLPPANARTMAAA